MTGSSKQIQDGLINNVIICRELPFYVRLDVLPFIIVYFILFCAAHSKSNETKVTVLVVVPFVLVCHLILFLTTQWSVELRRRIGFIEATDVLKSTHVHVLASKHVGEDRIVPIVHESNTKESNDFSVGTFKFHLWSSYFEFQKVRYFRFFKA